MRIPLGVRGAVPYLSEGDKGGFRFDERPRQLEEFVRPIPDPSEWLRTRVVLRFSGDSLWERFPEAFPP